MAYSAQRNSADRTKTVILVALVEAATLYAVVTNNNTGCRSTVATVGVSIEPLVDIDIASATSC